MFCINRSIKWSLINICVPHSSQPDTLIISAQYDPLRDEGEEYGHKLKEAGNSVTVRRIDNTLHGYFSLSAKYSAVKESYDIINKFLREDK